MINEVSRRLADAKMVAIDVETNGLDWRSCFICGWVFTFGPREEDTYYLPVRHETGPNHDPAKVRDMINSHQDVTRHWVGHNLAFDLAFIHKECEPINGTFEDTMVNACLINEFEESYSLAACAENVSVQSKKSSEILQHIADTFGGAAHKNRMGEFWRLPADDAMAHEYAKGDGTTTWQLWEVQQRRLEMQELGQVHKIECDLIPVLNRMTMRGIKIDVPYLHRLKDHLEKEHTVLMKEIGGDININSSKQIAQFFSDRGYSGWPTTEKGNPSFTEEWLSTNELGQKFVNVRRVSKMLSSFVDPILERHLHNGRVHPQYNQLKSDEFGTVTGRLSSSSPNVQAVPKRNADSGIPFRAIFVPDDGMIWGSADYSQCEPRLLAHYSNCKVLVDGYSADPPVDAHTAVATAAGIDRQSGKRLNQALLTGAGIKKATLMLGKPPKEAEAIVKQYFSSMPEIRTLQEQAASVMRERGYVKSIFGRRARLEKSGYEYKAVNRLLQCSNADMIKLSMVKVDEYCMGVGGIDMLNNVHDSIDFQFSPDRVGAYRGAIELMCQFPQVNIPIVVDDDTGGNWGEASYGTKYYEEVMTKKGLK